MDDCRHYSVYPSGMSFSNCFKELQEFFTEGGTKEVAGVCPDDRYRLQVTPTRSLQARQFPDCLKALEKNPTALPILIHSHWKTKQNDSLFLGFRIYSSHIEVDIEAEDPNIISAFHDRIRDIFHASSPGPERRSSEPRLHDLKKSVFLAHRFDDKGNSVASKLAEFLRRLGFDVLEGAGYEAKPIPDKVMAKIRSQDIFICVVTEGSSAWILSETAFARGLNKFLIVLCERHLHFEKGIIGGDYEHLSFPDDRIQDVYSDLLYTLPR